MAVNVWITNLDIDAMFGEARSKWPRETGGIFVGYFSKNGDAVIKQVSGPGPGAIHRYDSFEPDAVWQQHFVAEAYANSGRLWGYLGDWHSHPDGGASLSAADKDTLAEIRRCKAARLRTPVMGIVSGTAAQWDLTVWRLAPRVWNSRNVRRLAVFTY